MPVVARRRGRGRRVAARICVVAGALGLAAAAGMAVQGWQAKGELDEVVRLADDLVDTASARDFASAETIVARLRMHADRAEGLTAGPLWTVAAAVPGIGPNVEAVRTASTQLARVADEVLAPLVAVAGSVGGSASSGVAVERISDARQPLAGAARALAEASGVVGGVHTDALLPPVRDAVHRFGSLLREGAPVLEGVARFGAVLPGLLGADEPREILIMLQNSAELRTGGGITGTFVHLRAEDGALSMIQQADSGLFSAQAEAIADVPSPTTALYGDVVGRFVQNATMTPDFPVSASLASAWWSSRYAVAPDAVVAIDPIVLGALLRMHGPVTLNDGSQLDGDNLVQRLLIDPYLHLGPDEQTAYLQDVTSSVLAALIVAIDPLAWTEALLPVVAEGRVSVWSAHPEEQSVLSDSPVGGARARLDAAGDAGYAVYLNDATGGKMDSYLDVSIEAFVFGGCGEPGEAEIRVTMTNTARAEDISELPASMTGAGLLGTAVGDIGTHVTVAGPPGAGSGGVRDAAGALLSRDVLDGDRPYSAVRVNLSPGESEQIAFRFVLPPSAMRHPVLLHTPMIAPVPLRTETAPGCQS